MVSINLLTVNDRYGHRININKAHIVSIDAAHGDPEYDFTPITIFTVAGGKIQLHQDDDYDDLISRWAE